MHDKYQKQAGFHLIEVMLTLSLIIILSHLLVTHYQHMIAAEKRQIAESTLFNLGSQLEEYAMTHMTYEGATMMKLGKPEHVAQGGYLIKITVSNRHDYLISAVPLLKQALEDKRCGILSLSSSGTKFVSGIDGVDTCW